MRTGPGNAEGENQQGAFIRRGGLDVRDRTSWSMGEASGPERGEVSRETASSFDNRKRISMQMNMTVPGYPYPMRLGRHPMGRRVGSEARPLPHAPAAACARRCGPFG